MSSLNQILQYVKAESRVCPVPDKWTELWELLPDRKKHGAGWDPPMPLILAAWHHTSDAEKRGRLALHIKYAADHGVLNQVESMLTGLSPDQWVYEGEV